MNALIRLIGRALCWLLDRTQDPDGRPWNLVGALYVPEDAEEFVQSAGWAE